MFLKFIEEREQQLIYHFQGAERSVYLKDSNSNYLITIGVTKSPVIFYRTNPLHGFVICGELNMNLFLKATTKTAQTWNGATSLSTTQSALLDYFFKAGTYRSRPQYEVDADMTRIFAEDSRLALKLIFGLRLITRKPKNNPYTKEIQTGMGNRDEFYKAIVWLHNNQPKLLYDNLQLIPMFGSWKDFLNEPLIDVLNRERVFDLFAHNIYDDLTRKYLPQNRTKKKDRSPRDKKRSLWAKQFIKYTNLSPQTYRALIKGKGAAHLFQRQMGNNEWDKLNFKSIPGKALFNLMSRKGKDKKNALERHNQLDRFWEWMLNQKSIKFTGYPYELTNKARRSASRYEKMLYDKQFETVLETFKGHKLGNVLAALDTSGSMSCGVGNTTALEICISMGIVFSMLNIGWFKDHVAMFDDTSRILKLYGSMSDRVSQIPHYSMGSTNFQSLIDLICNIRKNNPEIPVSEFPETLLVISDMQFNPSARQYNWIRREYVSETYNNETNYETARCKLNNVGLPDIRIIWWCVNGQTTKDFPSNMNDKGVYMIGGFDPSNLKSLMGLSVNKKDFVASKTKEENPMDGLTNFLNQPIFSLLQF